MDFSDIYKYHHLSDIDNKILNSVLEKIKNGNNRIPIRDVADETFVSTTTIINLAKRMGFDGYSDMIFSLKQAVSKQVTYDLSYGLSNITESKLEKIDELVENIIKSKKIYIVSLGFSTIVASYFIKRLSTLDILAYDGAPEDNILNVVEPSVVIFISKSGETEDLITIARKANLKKHKIYCISTNANGRLCKIAKDTFIIKSDDKNPLINIPDFFVGKAILLCEHIIYYLYKKLR